MPEVYTEGHLSSMTRNALLNIVIALLLAILGVVGYKLAPSWRSSSDMVLPATPCDPSAQTCSATLPDGTKLAFSVTPAPIRPLQTLQLAVRLSGHPGASVEVDFEGRDMKMGLNRTTLVARDGVFIGQSMLPVCVSGRMTWAATVIVDHGQGRIAAPFHFSVGVQTEKQNP